MYAKIVIYSLAAAIIAMFTVLFSGSKIVDAFITELVRAQVSQFRNSGVDIDVTDIEWKLTQTSIKQFNINYLNIINSSGSATVRPSLKTLLGQIDISGNALLDNIAGKPIPFDFHFTSSSGHTFYGDFKEYPLINNIFLKNDLKLINGNLTANFNLTDQIGNIGFEIKNLTFATDRASEKGGKLIRNLLKTFFKQKVPDYLINGSILGNLGSISITGIIDYDAKQVTVRGLNILNRIMRILGSFSIKNNVPSGNLRVVVKNDKISEVQFIVEQLFNTKVEKSNIYEIKFNGLENFSVKPAQ